MRNMISLVVSGIFALSLIIFLISHFSFFISHLTFHFFGFWLKR